MLKNKLINYLDRKKLKLKYLKNYNFNKRFEGFFMIAAGIYKMLIKAKLIPMAFKTI